MAGWGSPHRANERAVKLLNALLNNYVWGDCRYKKVSKSKPLHSRRKTKGYEQLQNKSSRSPNEADLNKIRSLKNRDTIKLNINLKHSFNGGTTRSLKFKTQNHSKNGGTETGYWTYRCKLGLKNKWSNKDMLCRRNAHCRLKESVAVDFCGKSGESEAHGKRQHTGTRQGRHRLFEHMRSHGEQVETLRNQGRQSDTWHRRKGKVPETRGKLVLSK